MVKERFRKEALRRLKPSDQDSQLIALVGMRPWVALLSFALIAFGVFIWLFLGKIPITANGLGVFYDPNDVKALQSISPARVAEINVAIGDRVTKGMLIATLENPSLSLDFKLVRDKISMLENEIALDKRASNKKMDILQKLNLFTLKIKRMKLKGIEEALKASENDPLPSSQLQGEFYDLKIAIERLESEIQIVKGQIANPHFPPELDKKKWELISLKEFEKELQATLSSMEVRSPIDGTVLDLNVYLGKEVEEGFIMMWLHEKSRDEDANLIYSFFPVEEARLMQKGMKALIEFDSVNTKKYGKMLGKVLRVIPMALSDEGQSLGHIPSLELRKFLSSKGALVLVEIEPQKDPQSPTGYRWSTSHGPEPEISRGKIVSIRVILDEIRPISYLLPNGQ